MPVKNIENKANEQEIELSEPKDNGASTNGELLAAQNDVEIEIAPEKEDSDTESSSSSSSHNDKLDANNEEVIDTQAVENISKVEVQKSYAQLITPSGFNAGFGSEVANDNDSM